MTFLQVRYFVEVAKRKSLTGAANYLCISEQAVSKQLKSMEKELGIQLFYVKKKQVVLTTAGIQLFQVWEPMLMRTDAALQQIYYENNHGKRSLRMGVLEYNHIINSIIPVLADYEKTYTGQQIEILTGCPAYIFHYAQNGQIDLMLSFSTEIPENISPDWIFPVCEMQPCIVLSQNHPLAAKEELRLSDIRDENICVLSENHSLKEKEHVCAHCRSSGFEPKISFFASPESIEVNMLHNGGVYTGFKELFRNFADGLKIFPISYPANAEPTRLVCVSLSRKNAATAKKLANLLNHQMNQKI